MLQTAVPIQSLEPQTRWSDPRPLNSFQKMMLAWDEIHPYNAVHSVTLRGTVEIQRLRDVVVHAYGHVGIGQLHIAPRQNALRYARISDPHVRHIHVGAGDPCSLERIIQEELNRSFPTSPHDPLHWTVVENEAKEEFTLVAGYHHVAGDAHSIQMLLVDILTEYFSSSLDDDVSSATSDDTSSIRKNTIHAHSSVRISSFVDASRQYFQFRKAHRMHEDRSGDTATACIATIVPDRIVESLSAYRREQRVGRNDVMLAALVTAIAQMTPRRRTHRQRRKIAVATAYSHRRGIRGTHASEFGVQVGYVPLLIERPDDDWPSLVQQIAAQTKRLRSTKRHAETPWRFLFVKYLWPLLRIPHTVASYRKVFPICAGVSTVAIDNTRFAQVSPFITNYVRACPPGPAMPILLAPTFCNGELTLGLTYRVSCLDANMAASLLDNVVDSLGTLRISST